MKITTLCLLTLCSVVSLSLKAETTIQVGNGSGNATSKGPWYQLQANNKSKKVILFTEAELAAQGIVPGVIINAMKWYKTTNDSFINGANATARLYMRSAGNLASYGNSNYNVLDYIDNGFLLASTVHYNSGSSNIGLSDWVGFTDFYYTYAGGNLEVYVDWRVTTGTNPLTTTGAFKWQYSSTGISNRYMWYHGVPYNSSDFNIDNDRPNTLIVFTTPNCLSAPVAGTVVSTLTGGVCQGENFALDLAGNSTSTSQTYTWQHATSPNGPWTDYSVPLQLPLIGIAAPAVTTYYRAKVTCGNYVSYSDTTHVLVYGGFGGGTYTINDALPTGGGNFHSFHDAVLSLGCGITGPVTFNVVPGSGPYNEQIVIPQVGGASILNTITINGNNATIGYDSYSPMERAIIKLDGADYVTLNDLNINVQGTTTNDFGYGVHIIHNADLNTIKNCRINVHTAPGSASSDKYAGIVINGHAQDPLGVNYADCDINIIDDNTITGGYYGIILSGNSESSTIMGNVITGNSIRDFYNYGIYATNNSIAIIEGNHISRPTLSNAGNFTGIQLSGYNASSLVLANKIHGPFMADLHSEKSATAISVINCNPGEGSEDVIANNIVYDFKSNGSQYGLMADGSGYVKFQHNTVSLEHENALCSGCGVYGFYQGGAAISNLDFSNNIISLNGMGEGKLRAMHFTGTTNGTVLNNNNYYIAPGTGSNASIGSINGQTYTSLLLWKVGVLGDLLSVSKNPQYQEPLSGNMRPTNPSLDNSGLQVGILIDAVGTIRNLTTPDIGAYEFDENTLNVRNTQNGQAGEISIYPNPSTGVVNIGGGDKVNVNVSSVDGRILVRKESTNSVDISDLAGGLYILEIKNSDGAVIKTEKILKNTK